MAGVIEARMGFEEDIRGGESGRSGGGGDLEADRRVIGGTEGAVVVFGGEEKLSVGRGFGFWCFS